ncbi:glycosyltransferase family 2 protein [Parashewanella spongiae]|uniref:Glycosyltransferase family 2 protein n=1 Tax=Parashewanella spongiae TaxID=342950 RepID=A0A3A6TYP6_9GAMM|nr:glycosyltransferase family 2 protein [Parashewanella spongiae]MCL1077684.1 glycosyltransferase family 2 protein [Parashewanella spongiae]RJY18231.1 glycosyltransferase family 2 protein [Parashewanella spongiae]
MKSSEKVSIIVAAYNAEKYLDDCIQSVISQTYKNWELIVVNDGSVDSTGNIVERYKKKYQNIKLINQSNQGAISARNNGLRFSSGVYFVLLDADDILYESKLEKQVSYFNSLNDKVSLVFGRSHICNEELKVTSESVIHNPDKNGSYSSRLLITNLFPVHAAMFRWSHDIDFHRTNIVTIPDWELWLDVADNGLFRFHDDLVCAYRQHSDMSAKQDKFDYQIRQREGLYKKIISSSTFITSCSKSKFDVYFTTGRAIHKFCDYEKARSYYLKALKKKPYSAKCLLALTLTWLKTNV